MEPENQIETNDIIPNGDVHCSTSSSMTDSLFRKFCELETFNSKTKFVLRLWTPKIKDGAFRTSVGW